MTLQNTSIVFPETYTLSSAPFNSVLLDAAADRYAYVFEVPPGDTGKILNEVMFRTGAVTTSQSLDCRIETVDPATGNPTGALYGGSTAATNAGAFSANTAYLFSFGTGATVMAGDRIAVVIQYTGAAGALNIAKFGTGLESAFPYLVTNTSGTYSKTPTDVAVGHLKYSDGTYMKVPIMPYINAAESAYASTDERGAVWIPRFKCRLAGIRGNFRLLGDATIKLYEGVTSPVEKATTPALDKDIVGNNAYARHARGFYFTSSYVVTVGTKYFISLTPSGATNVSTWEFDVYAAGALDHLELGQDFYHGSRAGGAVTETTTKRASIGLIIDQLDDGAGGGGAGGISKGRLLNSGGF